MSLLNLLLKKKCNQCDNYNCRSSLNCEKCGYTFEKSSFSKFFNYFGKKSKEQNKEEIEEEIEEEVQKPLLIENIYESNNLINDFIKLAIKDVDVLEKENYYENEFILDSTESTNDSSQETEEEIDFNVEDYVVNDYEQDLETAINLSLASKKKNTCIICCDNKINVAFIPCGHFVCCHECANKCKKKCPICRKKFKSLQKIYTMV